MLFDRPCFFRTSWHTDVVSARCLFFWISRISFKIISLTSSLLHIRCPVAIVEFSALSGGNLSVKLISFSDIDTSRAAAAILNKVSE